MKRRSIAFAVAFTLILVGDLVTKYLIVANMRWREGFPVIDGFFNIVRAHNRGAAFGLLSDGSPSIVIPFFVVVAIAALGMLIALLRRLPEQRILVPGVLGAIGGGAIGNLIDRIR
ncbi:MAG: signal peptidase II, partial [Candidatus Dadabacteria bacterium]